MRVIEPGHIYSVANFNNKGRQTIRLVMANPESGILMTGTTNEELVKLLLHRLNCQYEVKKDPETMQAIECFRNGLYWLDTRRNNSKAEKAFLEQRQEISDYEKSRSKCYV